MAKPKEIKAVKNPKKWLALKTKKLKRKAPNKAKSYLKVKRPANLSSIVINLGTKNLVAIF